MYQSMTNYGYAFSYTAMLSLRKIVAVLMLVYCLVAAVSPELIGYCAVDMSDTSLNTSVGGGSNTGLPWEGPMMTLQRSLTGPVAKAVAMIVVVVAGIFVALGEGGPAGRLVGRLVFGLGLLFGALTIISSFMAAN